MTRAGPAPVVRLDRGAGPGARAGLVAALAATALGLPVGLLWGLLAPREEVTVGPRGAVTFLGAGGDLFVGADLLFVLLSAVAGAVAGVVAHARAGDRGWPVVVGLAVGGVVGALLAVRVGEPLGRGSVVFAEGQVLAAGGEPLPADGLGTAEVALQLRAPGALVVLPLAAVVAHLTLQLLRPRAE